jgi:hypothetical protein
MRDTKHTLTRKLADITGRRRENEKLRDDANDKRLQCSRFADLYGARLELVMETRQKEPGKRVIAQELYDLATLAEENAERRYRLLREKGQRLLVRELALREQLGRLCSRTSRRAGR